MTRVRDAALWKRVEAVLDEAFRTDPQDWPGLVARRCSGDPELQRIVERYLAADERAGAFLESGAEAYAEGLLPLDASESAPEDAEGRIVGPYRIVRRLGRGGMGEVFLAERADGQFRQQVALKLIRAGLETEAVRDRFLRERQILAGLQHDGIARLLDGGVLEDGRPYFALEYVDGRPITESADEAQRTVADRVDLLIAVGEAVAYAQRRLIVHRDLKPSNILVTTRGSVKLLDFGIAKLFEEEEKLTREGSRLLTPEYAAPEQLRGEPVTTATDVYALGCVLYELLSGRHPHAGATTVRGELERRVLSGDVTPLSRVVTTGTESRRDGEVRAVSPERISQDRRTTVPRLKRELSGDLSTIAARALATDPEHRYATAQDLVDDLRRYREGRPILARPDSVGYRLRKWATRHRTGVAAGGVVALALLAGGIATVHQADRAAREARRAVEARDFLVGLFEATDPDIARGRDLTAVELLEAGADRIDGMLADEPVLQADMLQVIGRTFLALGRAERAELLFRRATELRTEHLGPEDPETVTSLTNVGEALHDQSRHEAAESVFVRVRAIEERRFGAEHPRVARAFLNLAATYRALGRFEEAESLYVRGLELDRRIFGDRHLEVARDLGNYAVFLSEVGRYDEAVEAHRESLAILRESPEAGATDVARAIGNLGEALKYRGDLEEAERLSRECVDVRRELHGEAHPALASALRRLGAVLQKAGRLDEANGALEESVAMSRATLGEAHVVVATSLNELAINAFYRGDLTAARERFAEALGAFERILPQGHPTLITLNNNLATVALESGDVDRAESAYDNVLRLRREKLGEDHPDVALAWHAVGSVHAHRNRWDEAAACYEKALSIYAEVHDGPGVASADTRVAWAGALEQLDRLEESERELRRALEYAWAELSEDHRVVVAGRLGLGRVLVATGRAAEGLPHLEFAWRTRRDARGDDDARTAQACVARAASLAALGRSSDAREGLAAAEEILRRTWGPDHPDVRLAESTRRSLR